MPYKTIEVKAEKLLTCNGISVYHTYKHDNVYDVQRHNLFTTDKYGSEDGEDTFDVRDIEGFKWDGPQYGDKYVDYIKSVIKWAIKNKKEPFNI